MRTHARLVYISKLETKTEPLEHQRRTYKPGSLFKNRFVCRCLSNRQYSIHWRGGSLRCFLDTGGCESDISIEEVRAALLPTVSSRNEFHEIASLGIMWFEDYISAKRKTKALRQRKQPPYRDDFGLIVFKERENYDNGKKYIFLLALLVSPNTD